ncbi:putative ABC transport system permease protein [Fontibacillus solani]|uniref:Putative ABC transport system permease protein n=1 Tax=Fontibacillus solani TaxID=1572857 RepID=A0A7W3SP90_9BACL|nr:ABC transporter permease [Fontibacillus solani]MBA9083564.1 putative ABC transport system permease protein [Fontibacillus solani]
MRKKALWSDIFREIWHTKARFLSIFAIIALGVGFFSGIKATGPNMLDTADRYYKQLGLMDIKVQSTYGLTDDDIDLLRNHDGIKQVQPEYSGDVFLGDSGLIAKVHSYNEKDVLNRYVVTTGRMPQQSGEIVIDDLGTDSDFAIGDKITFTNPDSEANLEDTFKTLTYEIVGKVRSAVYINATSRGTSSIGKGTADLFAVIPSEDFSLSVYTEAYLSFEDTAGAIAYTEEYDELIDRHMEELENELSPRPALRLEEVRLEGQSKLDEAKEQIEEGKTKLADAEKKLSDARSKLEDGKKQYEQGVSKLENELSKGQAKLDSAAMELENGKKELQHNRLTLREGQNKLNAAKKQLEAEQAAAAPRLKQGKELAQGLMLAANSDPENMSAEQKQQYIAGAKAADSQLGEVVANYMSGTVDVAVLQGAIGGFQKSLTEAEGKLTQAAQQLQAQEQTLDQGLKKLAAGEKKIAQGEADWKTGTSKLAEAKETGEQKLADAKVKLAEGQAEYDKGLAEYNEEKGKADKEIADAEHDLAEGQKDLNELKLPKYYVLDRSSTSGYTEYSDNADRLAAIATAFPVFFFLIAALVSLTTMTRMVEEQRLQIGTLKALGYSNGDIMKKFLIYASFASIAASIVGLAIGYTLFPKIIFDAYGTLYNLPDISLKIYASYSIISVIVALICTTITALITTRVELRSDASVLMRPKAPKSGQRIMLERIPVIWKRLGFIGKVTARNLFRYKQRMFMTVCGVAGCTALILTGFGMRDSIGDVSGLQYGQIMKYNAIVAFNDDHNDKENQARYDEVISNIPEVTGRLKVTQESMTAIEEGVNNQSVKLFVPETTEHFEDFVVLKERGGKEREQLGDGGAIITEKLAKLYSLNRGDILTLQNNDNERFELKVAGITENYAMHYIYMTPGYYEEIFGDSPEFNTELLNYDLTDSNSSSTAVEDNSVFEDDLGAKLTALDDVMLVSFSSGVGQGFKDTLDSMNIVVIVLIVSAAALAFVVLYNLTNINVSERIRELSTIKVLGFYDKEVTMYIYRENLILTFLGIVAGNFAGILLHRFVLRTAEIDIMMFSPTIGWLSYVYASLLTLLFSGIVMISMHYKLKHIDMIEALKSVE